MFLRDQFSGPASRIRTANKSMQDDMRKLQEETLRTQRNIHAGIALAGVAATRGLARAVKEASMFGYEMEFVKSVTSATASEAASLGKLGMKLGQDTMFFAQDVAEGMRFMAMAGMSAQQVKQNIQGAVNLAGSTKSQLGGKGGAADIMTNVMKQFQIDFKHTTAVADILSYAVTRSNTNLFDLGEALKYAGATSMDLGISLQESTAMVMALGNAGMQGSMAGVAMENAMRYMSRAFSSFGSGPSKKALAQIGMTVNDVVDEKGNLLSMTTIMERMGKAIDRTFGPGMNIEKQGVLQSIFGVRGKRSASLFLRNLQEFSQFTSQVSTQSLGHSSRVMDDMMNTLQGQILRTGSSWQNMWISFTKSIEPTVKRILKIFEQLFTIMQRAMDVPFLGPMLSHGIAGFILIRTVASAFKMVQAGIRLLTLQNQTAMTSYSATTVAGFNAMTAASSRFNSSMATGNIMSMAKAGQIKGITLNSAGRLVAKSKTGMNMFVSGAQAASVAAGAARVVGGRVVAKTATSLMLGRIVGFLGGPIGMALSFILPAAIGALTSIIRSHKDSTERNTKALDDEIRYKESGIKYNGEFVPRDIVGARVLAMQSMGRDIVTSNMITSGFKDAVEEALMKISNINKNGDLIINLDGETIFKSPLDSITKQFRAAGMF